ncbi:MAG: hypothetical protein ACXWNZ_09540 [Vulcanimicrobiaceae bacterium]
MSLAVDTVQLRPLGLGEIFDRAVTLYVRNFAAFSVIALFLLAPLCIAQYFVLNDQQTAMDAILRQMQHPKSGAPPAFPFSPSFFWLLIVSALLTPFANVATAIGVAQLYGRERVDWRRCYAGALRRWSSILAVLFAQICIAAGAAVIGVFAIAISTGVSVLLFQSGVPATGVIFAFVTAALALAWLAFFFMLYLCAMFMFDAVAIEGATVGQAIGSGFARIFNRAQFWKGLLVGLSVFAVQLGVIIVASLLIGLLELSLKSHVVDTIAQGVVSLLSTTFLAILIAIYYYDVRVRREGLDLQSSVEQLSTSTRSPA